MVRLILFEKEKLDGILSEIGMRLVDGCVALPGGEQARRALCGEAIGFENFGNIMPGSVFYCKKATGFVRHVANHQEGEPDLEKVYEELKSVDPRLIGSLYEAEKALEKQMKTSIKDANVLVLLDNPVVRENLGKLTETFGLGRRDLFLEEIEIATPTISHGRLARILAGYIGDEDLYSLVIGMAVVQLEEKGEPEAAYKLLSSMSEDYGDRGKAIYRMVKSDLFHNFVLPVLTDFLAELETKDEVVQSFGEFFDRLVDCLDQGIWVNHPTPTNILARQTEDKLREDRFVCLYGRGMKNVKRIDRAVLVVEKKLGDRLYTPSKETYGLERNPTRIVRLETR